MLFRSGFPELASAHCGKPLARGLLESFPELNLSVLPVSYTHLAEEGISIIMISSELPELINISTRIAVMHEGELNKIFDCEELAQYDADDLQKEIMFYATGERD